MGVAEGEALAAELEARGDLAELNRLCFMLMLRYLWWGDFERGIATCDRAFDLAARLGVPPVQYATIKAACLWMLGRYGEAWTWLQREVADEEHPFGRAFRELGEGVFFSELGAYERAVTTLRGVVEEARRLSRTWMEDAADAWLGLALARLGTLDDGWVREVWGRLDRYLAAVPTPIATAEILLAQGELDAAVERLDEVGAHAERQWLRPRLAMIAELRSRVLLLAGRTEEALATAEAALPLAEAMAYRPMVWRLLAARAAALAALGRDDEAQTDRRAALAIVRELAATVEDDELRQGFLDSAEVAAIANG